MNKSDCNRMSKTRDHVYILSYFVLSTFMTKITAYSHLYYLTSSAILHSKLNYHFIHAIFALGPNGRFLLESPTD